MTTVYISPPCNGRIYIAERSSKGYRKLLWSAMTQMPDVGSAVIDANRVPVKIRRAAYRKIYKCFASS